VTDYDCDDHDDDDDDDDEDDDPTAPSFPSDPNVSLNTNSPARSTYVLPLL
jgi:hypothetical protein